MNVAQQTAAVVAGLPEEKARSVLEYAQFLADKADEQAWEATQAKAAGSARFQDVVHRARADIADGKSEPMDQNRL